MDFLIHWPLGPVVATVQCQGLPYIMRVSNKLLETAHIILLISHINVGLDLAFFYEDSIDIVLKIPVCSTRMLFNE